LINLLSLLSLLQAVPAVSPDSSVGIEQDFSALLTEMVGDFAIPAATTAVLETSAEVEREPIPELRTPPMPMEEQSSESAVPDKIHTGPTSGPTIGAVYDRASFVDCQKDARSQTAPTTPDVALILQPIPIGDQSSDVESPLPQPNPDKPVHPAAVQPDTSTILADLKALEVTVEHEMVRAPKIQPRSESPSRAVVTADPIARIRESYSPLRVLPVRKVVVEEKSAEQKNESRADSNHVPQAAVPSFQPSDQSRGFETIDQPRPAQLIEVPHVPKLQVVRTVSMQVGEAGSEVIVRIEDRGGTINLQFGTGSDTMHRSLQSSIGALVQALRLQRIDVSNVEVSRKAPMHKVRRMKEAY